MTSGSAGLQPCHLLFLALALAGQLACAPKARPPSAPSSRPSLSPTAALQQELTDVFGAPSLDQVTWAALVRSLDRGETLFHLNEAKLMMPASNMKIVTLAVAAERLGWDFSYDTSLVATGPIEHGVLEGDLVVVGSGDPTIVRRDGAVSVFERWADELAAAGIHAIDGRLVGDDNAFDDEPLGAGWAWDERMHRDPRHQAAFEATLPIAGKDGTLERRMRGSAAEGNARAKTGTIANVRTLSGYVRTRDGELLAFSILANHFTAPAAVIDAVTDLVVERLAAFSRR